MCPLFSLALGFALCWREQDSSHIQLLLLQVSKDLSTQCCVGLNSFHISKVFFVIKGARDFFLNESGDFGEKYIATIEKKRLGGRRGLGINRKQYFFFWSDFARWRLCWEEENLPILLVCLIRKLLKCNCSWNVTESTSNGSKKCLFVCFFQKRSLCQTSHIIISLYYYATSTEPKTNISHSGKMTMCVYMN